MWGRWIKKKHTHIPKTAISGNTFETAVPDKATYNLWFLESSRKYNIKLLALV